MQAGLHCGQLHCSQSLLAMQLLQFCFAGRVAPTKIEISCLHPGTGESEAVFITRVSKLLLVLSGDNCNSAEPGFRRKIQQELMTALLEILVQQQQQRFLISH